MHPIHLRRLLSVALAASFLLAAPTFAQGRRRAVAHPSAGGKVTAALITGTVLDNVTGAPVVAARVEGGGDSDTTDKDGKFDLKNLESFNGRLDIDVTRTGYTTKRITFTTSGNQTGVTVRVDPTATVRVRRIDNSTFDLDFESILFGYPVPFSGYRSAEFEEFCANGVESTIDRAQIKRITGPAVEVQNAACCPNAPTLKVNVELKSGAKTDMYFVDACHGFSNIDLIGREHVNAKFQYIPFSQIAEVIFP